ncbi:MAG: hypothetical protein ACX939_00745 [Hyphococcus sp.]
MARHPDKNRYALAVGHIAIEWNYLEHDLQQLGNNYLTVDADVAAHIFAFMGNVTKVEFISYLVDKFEADADIRAHLEHFLRLYNRLRANRNVVEHGIPALTASGAYLDEIIKIDRRGDALPFAASQATLNAFLQDLRAARAYAHSLKQMIDVLADDGESIPDPASLAKPRMPKRLSSPSHRKG